MPSTGSPWPRGCTLPAPAKLNLGLRVVGRRADGYHLLDSLLVPIDLADELDIEILGDSQEVRVDFSLESEAGPTTAAGGAPPGATNLAVRAARAFLEAAGLDLRVRIRLRKRIPVGAGLGGGSSDAAAVLRGLAQLVPAALPADRLAEIGLGLGADVPFFLNPRPARVGGIGEQIEPLRGVPSLAVLLANPGISVATAAVYARWDQAGPPPEGAPRQGATQTAREGGTGFERGRAFTELLGEGLLRNDLEAAAVSLCPEIARLSQRLRDSDALAVGMSGSGATLFGVFSSPHAAREALREAAFEPPIWARVAASAGSG